jgi:hypothetical protein
MNQNLGSKSLLWILTANTNRTINHSVHVPEEKLIMDPKDSSIKTDLGKQ